MPTPMQTNFRPTMPQRYRALPRTCGGNLPRGAPGRTVGRQSSTHTNPSGRGSSLPDSARRGTMKAMAWARRGFLLLPMAFVMLFLVFPLAFMLMVSFWRRSVISMRPAFVLNNYADFLAGTRLPVLGRSFLISIEATAIGLLIAYPIAYF